MKNLAYNTLAGLIYAAPLVWIILFEVGKWANSYAYLDSILSSMKKAFWQASSTKFADIAELIVKPELIALVVLIIYVGVVINEFWNNEKNRGWCAWMGR